MSMKSTAILHKGGRSMIARTGQADSMSCRRKEAKERLTGGKCPMTKKSK